jgi:hypothetical protein
MGTAAKSSDIGRLNDLQISVLRLFEQGLSDAQTNDLRKILIAYFDAELKKELEKVQSQKQYTQEDFDRMLADDKFFK